jgi:hypothetical protein
MEAAMDIYGAVSALRKDFWRSVRVVTLDVGLATHWRPTFSLLLDMDAGHRPQAGMSRE